MQHARGDDLVGVVAPAQQLRDLQRVQDERRPIGVAALARVVLGGELQRATRDRQLRDEARELAYPTGDVTHCTSCITTPFGSVTWK